ncbi:MAG: zinc carboxypeptidase [Verrucomicrobiaceae bacterium]|nr:zinc carboxypeptidase [Verrucomicrobiaceae bacterium]
MKLIAICSALVILSTRAPALVVETNFEGASAADVKIDESAHSVSFRPAGDPMRGWPCWWYFKVSDLKPDETLTLRLRGSSALMPRSEPKAPLAASWAMPDQATYSTDGKTWLHTEPGKREKEWMIYTLKPGAASAFVAWGPPYTPETATEFVRAMSAKSPHAKAQELCQSRGGRPVPMLRVAEGDRPVEKRFGVWVEARQHAWESGSSWVAQGFTEWLLGAEADAAWLRQHAEIFIVPVMDVDNTAAGNGGKDELPQDHNRDWSDAPHWTEVATAQRKIGDWVKQGRMDVFLDLHNPAPGDKKAFFYALPADLMKEPMLGLRDHFIQVATQRIGEVFPMLDAPKNDGPKYHPLWRQISGTWVSMNGNPHTVGVCLETSWNTPSSTTTGYRSVGTRLASAVRAYLGERPVR